MENRKKYYLTALICAVAAVLVIGISVLGRKPGEIDEMAASRGKEQEGEIHYLDDSAIAAVEEAGLESKSKEAKALLDEVNQVRANAGLGALEWNDALATAAQVRAQECEKGLTHLRPNATDWWTVNSALMYGENLGWNYFDAKSVCAAWMASPTHAANILGNGFRTMGAAAYRTAGGDWYWALELGY